MRRKWIVEFGQSRHTYYTEYHALQMERALRLNGTPVTVTQCDWR